MRGDRQSDWRDRHLDGDPVGLDMPQHRSMSNRRCNRIQAPVSSAITMLSRPRMCDGGVMICMRSADGQSQRVAPVPHRDGERGVRVADRLGHPGGARAEHEHRVGVRAAASTDARLPGAIGSSRCSIGINSASTGWSPTACDGLGQRQCMLDLGALPRRADQDRDAPSRQMARSATTNSGRLDDISATRSPARTPRCSSDGRHAAGQGVELGQRVLPLLEGERDRAHSPRVLLAGVGLTMQLRIAYRLWRIVFSN